MPKKKSKAAAKTTQPNKTRFCRYAFIVIVFGLACLMGCAVVYKRYQTFLSTPLNLGAPERVIQIPSGAHAGAVVDILKRADMIEHDWMMLHVLRQSGLSSKIQTGNVVLHSGITPLELPEALAKVGKFAPTSVQLLYGMTLYDIASRLQSARLADAQLFLKTASDPMHVSELGVPADSLEGYLAAGAYTFEAGTTTDDIIAQMHARWRQTWKSLTDANRGAYERLRARGWNDHALVTLASIVEKEAVLDEERPMIARVFYNRLRKKMKLQSDPTCVYPPKIQNEKPTPERCKDPSNAYSTYVIAGLPPGPIAAPSAESLRAVLKPYDGPDAQALLYFAAKSDGSRRHYFSKTYAEHQQAVDYYLKKTRKTAPRGTIQPHL